MKCQSNYSISLCNVHLQYTHIHFSYESEISVSSTIDIARFNRFIAHCPSSHSFNYKVFLLCRGGEGYLIRLMFNIDTGRGDGRVMVIELAKYVMGWQSLGG